MKTKDNKTLRVNYGQGVIVLPEAVNSALSSAKKTDIIVLITLLSDVNAEVSAVAEKCSVSEDAVEKAIAFWRGAGILSFEKEETPVKEEKAVEKPKKVGKREDLGALPSYSSSEIAGMVENDREVALMIDECERALGKMLRVGEIAKIIALRDYLGFSPDYITTLCTYCAQIGKNSVRYLETTAISLYDDGITDKETLEEHLRKAQQKHDLEVQIRSLFGMNMTRALTTREKKFIESWTQTMGFGIEVIKIAYEITIDKINEPSLNYANAILESWNASGLKTEDEVRAQMAAEAEAKGEPAAGKSFDSTDFFEAALRRSYEGSGTAPEIAKPAPAQKKRK